MTEIDLILRDAFISDAAELALLDDMASHGLASWLWQGAVNAGKAETAFLWGRQRMLNLSEPANYTNAVVATSSDGVAGMSVGYVISKETPDVEFKTDIDVLAPIMNLFKLAKGAWLVDSLAVYPQWRSSGVGNMLLTDQLKRARNAQADHVALVAEDTNTNAINLYRKCGFQKVAEQPYVSFSKNNSANAFHLMTAQL